MTLCIAAVSRKGPAAHIVTVSDLMLSSDYMSVETRVLKVEPISPKKRWIMMFAGAPTPVGSIQRAVKARLAHCQETEEEVCAAVEGVYRDEVKRKIEGEILSPFGIDRETFLRRGRAWFGDQQFNQLVYEINGCKLGVDLLVAGFEPTGLPRIFSVSDPGTHESHERAGFYAIGSGAIRGLGSLYTHYDVGLSKSEMVYRVCEAKFLGQSASGVGKETYVLTFKLDDNGEAIYESLYPADVDKYVRPRWEAEGKPPIPTNMDKEIEGALRKTVWRTWKDSKLAD